MIEKKKKIKVVGWSLWAVGMMIVGFCLVLNLTKDKTNVSKNDVTTPAQTTAIDLTKELKERKKLLEQANLAPEYRKILQEIVTQLEIKIQREEEKKIFQEYLTTLEQEILDLEKQLTKPLSLVDKHNFTEQKLKKEKELIELKKQKDLFQEKEELQTQILPSLDEKLKEAGLKNQDKTNLTKEKTKWENRLQEIETLLTKIKYQKRINTLEKIMFQEKDENLKKLLEEEKNYLSTKI